MKRILSLTLVAIMMLTTMSLTSCEMLKGFIDGFVGELTTRTTITEEEWNKIEDISNFTLEMNTNPGKYIIEVSEDFLRLERSNSAGYYANMAYDLKNGYLLSETAVGWLAYEGLGVAPSKDELKIFEMGFLDKVEFSALTYNEETKSYTYQSEDAIYEFRFENGALRSIDARGVDPEDTTNVKISNVGTTVVEISEYIVINDGKMDPSKADASVRTTVTSEELAAHLDIRNATICAATLPDYGEAGSIILKLAENGMELSIGSVYEDEKQYMAFIDGIMYSVYERNGEYVASKYASLEEIDTVIATAKENLTIDYLTYNEEGRYYSLNLGDGQDFYFYFENGQLVRGAYVINYGSGDGSMEIHFIVTDVGTTIVDLPEFTVNGNSYPGVMVD